MTLAGYTNIYSLKLYLYFPYKSNEVSSKTIAQIHVAMIAITKIRYTLNTPVVIL